MDEFGPTIDPHSAPTRDRISELRRHATVFAMRMAVIDVRQGLP